MTLPMQTARGYVTTAIWVGGVLSIITLGVIARGDAILLEGKLTVLRYLADYYVPLLGVVAAFWLAEKGADNAPHALPPRAGGIRFAAMFLTVWALVPSGLLATSDTYATALKVLDIAKLALQPIAAASVAFTFAKSGSS
jgi:hypothetical protein